MTTKRLAVLGGGLGSLGAVAALTDPSNPRRIPGENITVYQIGWRLGGKGASGVNTAEANRVEEHGLHIWFGFYQNAFRLMRALMAEWNPGPAHPWGVDGPDKVWTHAWKPQSYNALTEYWRGDWHLWEIDLPEVEGTPGDDSAMPMQEVWDFLLDHNERHKEWTRRVKPPHPRAAELRCLLRDARAILGPPGKSSWLAFLLIPWRLLCILWHLVSNRGLSTTVWTLLRGFWKTPLFKIHQLAVGLSLARALFDVLETRSADIAEHGMDALDDTDLRDLLRRHGASETAVRAPILSSLYDAVFAQQGGDPARESLAAGCGLRMMLQAGMGDTIFTPLYEVLRRRGVQFRFFHHAKDIKLSADGKSVASILMGRQVTMTRGEYEPLISDGKGLHCWPSEPRWDQIAQAAAVQSGSYNLSHPESGWQDVEDYTLRAGADFDHVLLGISLAALPALSPDLMRHHPRFARMTESVQTVRTQAWQVWMQPDTRTMGWELPPPIFGNYYDPLNTWADFTHILPLESHPPGTVGSLHYFCGTLSDAVNGDLAVAAEVRKSADDIGDAMALRYWPGVRNADGTLNRSAVVMEYLRTNTTLSDRYVLSVAGSTQHRLWPHETGCDNLTFTGDWTRNGINAGCVEATVMSALLASHHLTSWPAHDDITGLECAPDCGHRHSARRG
jgi:uncharacterized protein with NAD-binding domain and iron-sulfur cluster